MLTYELESALAELYAEYDVEKGRLWENEAFIELLVKQKYNGIDSKVAWNDKNEDEQRSTMIWFYREAVLGYMGVTFPTDHTPSMTAATLQETCRNALLRVSGYTADQISGAITAELEEQNYSEQNEVSRKISELDLKIVGYFDAYQYDELFVSDTVFDYYKSWSEQIESTYGISVKEDRADHINGDYAFVIAPMPRDREGIETLMQLHYAEEGVDLLFRTNNAVMSTLGNFDDIIEVIATVFIWVGLGLAVFAAFLLMNFIATSISYKKRDIGILRAVGARSSDVFKIFFSEAFIIALINFLLSVAACIAVVIILNTTMRNQGINITLLRFGPLQALLMLAISVFVAFAASFLPVRGIARKKPVDAIKDR